MTELKLHEGLQAESRPLIHGRNIRLETAVKLVTGKTNVTGLRSEIRKIRKQIFKYKENKAVRNPQRRGRELFYPVL